MADWTDCGYPGGLVCKATADLISIGAMVECLYDPSHPSMELLEAKRAIHNALVALGAWSGALDNAKPAHAAV